MIYRCDERGKVYRPLDWKLYSLLDDWISVKSEDELRTYLTNHPDEDFNDVGIFMFIGLIFLAATVSLVFTWLYHALMESSEWQATVGKKLLGLVVTDMAGQRVSFWRATARHFAKIITNMVPAFIGYILAAFTEKKQALHDMLAGCLVLRQNI